MNYSQLKATEKRLERLIRLSKKAYERNDSKKEQYYANQFEAQLKEIEPLIGIDWPGLYPCFKYQGFHFYSLESVLNELFNVTLK